MLPKIRTAMCKRLRSLGLSARRASSVMDEVLGWHRNSGPEWTVSRLKQLKTNLLRLRAGEKPDWRWIRHDGNAPVGPFREIFRKGVSADTRTQKGRRDFQVALSTLMVYSLFEAREVTPAQWKKFQFSVEHKPGENSTPRVEVDVPRHSRMSIESSPNRQIFINWGRDHRGQPRRMRLEDWSYARDGSFDSEQLEVLDLQGHYREGFGGRLNFRGRKVFRPADLGVDYRLVEKHVPFEPIPDSTSGEMLRPVNIFQFPLSESKVSPAGLMKVPRTQLEDQIETFLGGKSNRLIHSQYRELYDLAMAPLIQRGYQIPRDFSYGSDPGVGRITFIQEPGYKLRAVANPHLLHQVVLEPLKRYLMDLLKQDPQDFTFRQEEAFPIIQGWLREPEYTFSVDLSDATNNFPLEVILHALSGQTGARPWLDCFSSVSRAGWLVTDPHLSARSAAPGSGHKEGVRRLMYYKTGQPMGLGPSFAAFALTHHWVLKGIQKEVPGTYAILGDDIVIHGRALYDRYREVLQVMDCPVSEAKCLSSTSLAEFAGRAIDRSGVYSQSKWRNVSDNSFIDLARNLGVEARRAHFLFGARQRRILKHIQSLPKEIGGLGFNPMGIPLGDRLSTKAGRMLLARFMKDKPEGLVTLVNPQQLANAFSAHLHPHQGLNLVLEQRKGEALLRDIESRPLARESRPKCSRVVHLREVRSSRPYEDVTDGARSVKERIIDAVQLRDETLPLDPIPGFRDHSGREIREQFPRTLVARGKPMGDPRGESTLVRVERQIAETPDPSWVETVPFSYTSQGLVPSKSRMELAKESIEAYLRGRREEVEPVSEDTSFGPQL